MTLVALRRSHGPHLKRTLVRALSSYTHTMPSPFAPSTRFHADSTPSMSTRQVTLPFLPELHNPAFLDKLLPPRPTLSPSPSRSSSSSPEPTQTPVQGNAFMAALNETANWVNTTNGALALSSTGSALLDVFSGLNEQTAHSSYAPLLRAAWMENAHDTLRLVWHLRSIHDGQRAREPFYRAFGWLYENHPRTAVANLEALVSPLIERELKSKKTRPAEDDDWTLDGQSDNDAQPKVKIQTHGYFKDLLNILVLATNGELTPTSSFNSLHIVQHRTSTKYRQAWSPQPRHRKGDRDDAHNHADGRVRISRAQQKAAGELASNAARAKRVQLHREQIARVEFLLKKDPAYRALYITVARIFAKYLAADVRALWKIADETTSAEERIRLTFGLSLAGKWAPSIGASHDRACNIATAIAELLYVDGALPVSEPPLSRPATQEEVHRIRSMYTRWVLSPLRRFMHVPEVFMSTNRWDKIKYSRVSSVCMNNNTPLFQKHDLERFSEYLLEVAQGNKTISGATLLPHELLLEAASGLGELRRQVIEAQWNTMVQSVRDAGSLENSLAVCDVSGSMGSFSVNIITSYKEAMALRKHTSTTHNVSPIAPALALSLVVAQTAREPWQNSFITFSATPQLVRLDPTANLVEQATTMSRANWDMNTSYSSVFLNLLLPMAQRHNLKREDMIKRLFVFSDMEFDNSRTYDSGPWATEHEIIKQAFAEAGYDMPEIVYWNLQGANVPQPVRKDEPGAALVTGFSPNMIKLFMEKADLDIQDEFAALEVKPEPEKDGDAMVVDRKPKTPRDPMSVMRRALDKPSFATLTVED